MEVYPAPSHHPTTLNAKNSTKVNAAADVDDNDDAGKVMHMSHLCFAGETKNCHIKKCGRVIIIDFAK